jgi:hypothetical protein
VAFGTIREGKGFQSFRGDGKTALIAKEASPFKKSPRVTSGQPPLQGIKHVFNVCHIRRDYFPEVVLPKPAAQSKKGSEKI